MRHDYNCSQSKIEDEDGKETIGSTITESCEECRKIFESSVHVCPHCWKPVSNAGYFGKRGKSIHLTGKCSEKFEGIPSSFVTRKATAARSVDVLRGYWASSEEASKNNQAVFARKVSKAVYLRAAPVVEPVQSEPVTVAIQSEPVIDPLAERLARLLEEQNELLRKLSGKPASPVTVTRAPVTELAKPITRDAIVKEKFNGTVSAFTF